MIFMLWIINWDIIFARCLHRIPDAILRLGSITSRCSGKEGRPDTRERRKSSLSLDRVPKLYQVTFPCVNAQQSEKQTISWTEPFVKGEGHSKKLTFLPSPIESKN